MPQARLWRDAATNSFMARASPVAGSITSIVSPAKSTNTFSPPTCVWRIALKAHHRCDVGRTTGATSGARDPSEPRNLCKTKYRQNLQDARRGILPRAASASPQGVAARGQSQTSLAQDAPRQAQDAPRQALSTGLEIKEVQGCHHPDHPASKVVLYFRPFCSLVKMDQGFMSGC